MRIEPAVIPLIKNFDLCRNIEALLTPAAPLEETWMEEEKVLCVCQRFVIDRGEDRGVHVWLWLHTHQLLHIKCTNVLEVKVLDNQWSIYNGFNITLESESYMHLQTNCASIVCRNIEFLKLIDNIEEPYLYKI